jgi:pimeloyl-ACP methyl ester carboxylesterase
MADCIRSTDLLLLPGMMCDETLWAPQIAALQGSVRIATASIAGEDSIEAIASRLLEQAAPRFALAGLSMGGIVAFEMWRQAPQRIERLALLDTNFRADPLERRAMRDRQMAQVAAGELEEVMREELKPNYLADCHSDNLKLLAEVLGMGLRLGETAFTSQSLALRNRPDSSATLATISCPTLVLCGAEDRLCSPELHSEMAGRIAGAELTIINECGHLSTLEQPQAVNRALSRWLTQEEQ